jgi:hypothetical protein
VIVARYLTYCWVPCAILAETISLSLGLVPSRSARCTLDYGLYFLPAYLMTASDDRQMLMLLHRGSGMN